MVLLLYFLSTMMTCDFRFHRQSTKNKGSTTWSSAATDIEFDIGYDILFKDRFDRYNLDRRTVKRCPTKRCPLNRRPLKRHPSRDHLSRDVRSKASSQKGPLIMIVESRRCTKSKAQPNWKKKQLRYQSSKLKKLYIKVYSRETF